MKKIICIFCILLYLLVFLCGCQPTPEEPIVVKKEELTIETAEETESSEKTETAVEEPAEKKWTFEKEYNDGKKLNVNAPIINNKKSGAPVVSLEKENFFGNIELVKNVVTALCDESYDVRESVGTITKDQLQISILAYQEELKELKEKGDTEGFQECQSALDKLVEQYQKAPSFSELPKVNFELQKVKDGSYQTNLLATNGEKMIEINFMDWADSIGSTMLIKDESEEFSYDQTIMEFVTPDYLATDESFKKGKELIDAFLTAIGADHLDLNIVTKYKDGEAYKYYYTREINGFKETYNNAFFGSAQTNEEVVKDLWRAETMQIVVANGELIYIRWHNPAKVVEIDNENTKIISFEEAKEVFLKHIDRMLLPNIEDGDETAVNDYIRKNTAVNITKIELGLTKLLMKDSEDSYKLIPTWNFYGYEAGSGHEIDENRGAEKCFVMVNAIDGSIVNYKAMN